MTDWRRASKVGKDVSGGASMPRLGSGVRAKCVGNVLDCGEAEAEADEEEVPGSWPLLGGG